MLMLPVVLAALHATSTVEPTGSVFNGRARQLAVRIPRIDASVTIDGSLSEAPWSAAAVLTGFSQYAPQDGVPAQDSTEVLVWYSPTAIYFGIRAFQPREQVRASLADRDKIAADDYVQILLGTFNDGRQASVFMVNPLGVQADGTLVERGALPGGGFIGGATQARESPDLSPDFVFQSKGRVTSWGYEVEIRIPFKSLRYQSADVQRWGLNIVRKVQYRGHEDSWAPAQRAAASFLAQGGTLDGLSDLHRGLVVDITPEATQRTEGMPGGAAGASAASAWRYDARAPTVGANVRWGVTNNLTLNGTANPDFSQVEADAAQISFDPRAALLFPEKRPFFLDGLEQFNTPNSLIYTRRLVQPVAAVKLTGKVASSDLAFLSAADAANTSASGRDHPVYNIVRLQRDLGSQSRLGMAYTDRVDGANWNRVVDVDGRLVWQKIYALQFQLAGSGTQRNGVRTNAPLWEARFNRQGKTFGWRSAFTGIGEDFRTQSGFIARAGQAHANFAPRFAFFGGRVRVDGPPFDERADPFAEAEIGQVKQADDVDGGEQDGRAGLADEAEDPAPEDVPEESPGIGRGHVFAQTGQRGEVAVEDGEDPRDGRDHDEHPRPAALQERDPPDETAGPGDQSEDGQQVGGRSEDLKRTVGQPGTERSDDVVRRGARWNAGGGKVRAIVGKERDQQQQADGQQDDPDDVVLAVFFGRDNGLLFTTRHDASLGVAGGGSK